MPTEAAPAMTLVPTIDPGLKPTPSVPTAEVTAPPPPSFDEDIPTLPPLPSELPPYGRSHAAPDLEATVQLTVRGITLVTASIAYSELRSPPVQMAAAVEDIGRRADELVSAEASDPSGTIDLTVLAFAIPGEDGASLMFGLLNVTDPATVDFTRVEIAGRSVWAVDEGTTVIYDGPAAIYFAYSTSASDLEEALVQLP